MKAEDSRIGSNGEKSKDLILFCDFKSLDKYSIAGTLLGSMKEFHENCKPNLISHESISPKTVSQSESDSVTKG